MSGSRYSPTAFLYSVVTAEWQLGAAITVLTPGVIKTPLIIALPTLMSSLKETGVKVNARSQEKLEKQIPKQ